MTCVWAPSTAFHLPDERQPRYGAKQVGYAAHSFHPDGTHDCELVIPPGAANLCIADFPQAYPAHGSGGQLRGGSGTNFETRR